MDNKGKTMAFDMIMCTNCGKGHPSSQSCETKHLTKDEQGIMRKTLLKSVKKVDKTSTLEQRIEALEQVVDIFLVANQSNGLREQILHGIVERDEAKEGE